MCTMKQACDHLGITYETLRFYCDEGLVPNVRRDRNNYRDFSERNLRWLESLLCLKRCGMSIHDMKYYMELCLQGISSVPERKDMLGIQRQKLMEEIAAINRSMDFIDRKQAYFDGILSGDIAYSSNLMEAEE